MPFSFVEDLVNIVSIPQAVSTIAICEKGIFGDGLQINVSIPQAVSTIAIL